MQVIVDQINSYTDWKGTIAKSEVGQCVIKEEDKNSRTKITSEYSISKSYAFQITCNIQR